MIGTGLNGISSQSGSATLSFPFEDSAAALLEDSPRSAFTSASKIPQVQAGHSVEDDVESAEKLLAFFLRHEEGPFPSDTAVTVGRVSTVRLLGMCGNHG
jgi:hypothetical protein